MGGVTVSLMGHTGRVAHQPLAWVVLVALGILPLVYFSLSKEVTSDPEFTLLVSQAVLEHGSIRLDPYQGEVLFGAPFQAYLNDGTILEQNGHFYNYYPAGPSLLAIPFVFLVRLRGWDMTTADNYTSQYLLAALTVALVFLLVYALARAYLDGWSSLAMAVVTVLGSGLISTLGTALWSLNFTTIIILLLLLLFVRGEQGKGMNGYLVGLLLFLAFLCRASAAAFILPALVYLMWRNRPVFIRAAGISFAFLLLFLGFNQWAYGDWLPAYYTVERVQVARPVPVWVGIVGNLASPSRGVFIFSPFLVLVLAGVLRFWRALARQPLFWLCLAWFGLHLWLVARAASWWGGVSFGPRLLADAFPALVLITILLWHEAAPRLSVRGRRLSQAGFLTLGLAAIVINSGLGLYYLPVQRWNGLLQPVPAAGEPGLGELFDWQHAQILATNQSLCAWEWEKFGRYLPADQTLSALSIDQPLSHRADQRVYVPFLAPRTGPAPGRAVEDGNLALFAGWGPPAGDYRWSQCPTAHIVFRPGADFPESGTIILAVSAGSLGAQPVAISLNGTPVGELTWNDKPWETPFRTQEVALAAALIRQGELNTLSLTFPQAQMPPPAWQNGRFVLDQRPLALAFHELRFRPVRRSAPVNP